MEVKLYLLKRMRTGGAGSPESSHAETESRVMNARGWGRGGRSQVFNGLQFLLEVTEKFQASTVEILTQLREMCQQCI